MLTDIDYDDDYDYDDFHEVVEKDFNETLDEKTEKLAIEYIDKYFKEKEMHYGGEISKTTLHSDYYVSLVLNMDLMNGLDVAYSVLEREEVENDQELVISILDHCASLGIPKSFAIGLLLMHLEFCEGFNFRVDFNYG